VFASFRAGAASGGGSRRRPSPWCNGRRARAHVANGGELPDTTLTTLSFLFTTPGALSLKHPASGFPMKDVVLLGAMIATAAEALRAAATRKATRRTAAAAPAGASA
jgi:hypothetical protein